MKLYTAKEISVIIDLARVTVKGEEKYTNYDLFEMMTPIELPIEEIIYKQAYLHSYLNELPDENAVSYIEGANFVINQIKKQ